MLGMLLVERDAHDLRRLKRGIVAGSAGLQPVQEV